MNKNKIVRNIYYSLKRLYKALDAFFAELFKPTAFLKGEDFERCLRSTVFTSEKYDLVMKTHDFHENSRDYVESSLYPDYLFRERKTNKEFFVEAKYRESLYKGRVQWCNESQFRRYKKLGKESHVIVAIGFGGRPENPKHIYLVPLNKIEFNGLYPTFLKEYEFTESRKNILDSLMDKVYDIAK